ncbi:MAG: hypothetical protein M1326_09605, partial [Cyanobacteria bacterium]|nr:hypothetical protein [Cyanobacteriota bacterium]
PLLILFLEGKSVLFVSHTNPAVEVVNNKINSNFNNLMLRTGRKELREDLKGKFTELLLESQKSRNSNINYEILLKQWHNIQNLRNKLLGIDKVGNALESDINIYEINKKNFTKNNYLEDSFTKLSEFKINKLNETFYQLKRLSNKKYTFFEKFITIFNKNFIRKKEKDLLVNLYNEIPNDLMLILKDKQDLSVLDSWDEIFYERYIEYLNLLRLHEKIISQKQKIAKFPNKLELEGQILDLEENYYFSCNNFIQNIYIKKIFQDPKKDREYKLFF